MQVAPSYTITQNLMPIRIKSWRTEGRDKGKNDKNYSRERNYETICDLSPWMIYTKKLKQLPMFNNLLFFISNKNFIDKKGISCSWWWTQNTSNNYKQIKKIVRAC